MNVRQSIVKSAPVASVLAMSGPLRMPESIMIVAWPLNFSATPRSALIAD